MIRGLRKTCQAGLYRFCASKQGMLVLVVLAAITINSILRLSERFAPYSISCSVASYATPRCQTNYADNIAQTSYEGMLCTEPIDAVYTWVNGSDEAQIELLQRWKAYELGNLTNNTNVTKELNEQSSRSRFEDHDELLYSLRSLERYAGWVRHVYIVTNGQIPHWLDLSNPRISIVTHEQLFVNKSHLPVFSSPSIESHLHRIPGLSRRFLYLNDDTFFANEIHPDDFYSPTEGFRVYLSWPVPNCADNCPSTWIHDGFCDTQCNTTDCEYDGGDCLGKNVKSSNGGFQSQGGVFQQPGAPVVQSPGSAPRGPDYCAPQCTESWIGDKYCDTPCNVAGCGFDGSDCGLDAFVPANLLALNVSQRRRGFGIPWGTKAFYVPLHDVLPKGRSSIVDGSHDYPSWVRTATISQKGKMLIVTVRQDWGEDHSLYPTRCRFSIMGEVAGATVYVDFNVTVQQVPRVNMTRPPLPSTPSDRMMPSGGTGASSFPGGEAQLPYPNSDGRHYHHNFLGDFHHNRRLAQVVAAEVSPQPDATKQRAKRAMLRKLQELEAEPDRLDKEWNRALSVMHPLLPAEAASAASMKASTRRHLLDTFGDSLKYSNKLMSRRFGSTARKVPAHMVHFIDRDVISRLWELWPAEWENTSSHRFRSKHDVQYAFSHFYYVMSALLAYDPEKYFVEAFDHNANGVLDAGEERRMALVLWENHLPIEVLREWLTNTTVEVPSQSLPTSSRTSSQSVSVDPTVSAPPSISTTRTTFATLKREKASFLHHRSNQSALSNHTPHVLIPDDDFQFKFFGTPDSPPIPPEDMVNPAPDDYVEAVMNLVEHAVETDKSFVRYCTVVQQPLANCSYQTFTHALKTNSSIRALLHADEATGATSQPSEAMRKDRRLTPRAFAHSCLANVYEPFVHWPAFRFKVRELDDVTFFMIKDNTTLARSNMDHVLYKRPKFLCINDNMNHSHPDHGRVVEIIREFLEEYYPKPSSFERTQRGRNSTVDDTESNNAVVDLIDRLLLRASATCSASSTALERGKYRHYYVAGLVTVVLIVAALARCMAACCTRSCSGRRQDSNVKRRAESPSDDAV